jgi:hypothetical protein
LIIPLIYFYNPFILVNNFKLWPETSVDRDHVPGLLSDFYESIISFKDMLIKYAYPTDFNVKLKMNKSSTNQNSGNS